MSVWAYSKWWMADDIGSPQAVRRLAVTDLILAWLDTRRTAPAWTLERDSGPLQFSLRWWSDRRRTVVGCRWRAPRGQGGDRRSGSSVRYGRQLSSRVTSRHEAMDVVRGR
jgi:hypothetical protein